MKRSRRGRPVASNRPLVVPVKLRLYPGMDDDLIAWLDDVPAGARAVAVKSALRSGAGSVHLADLGSDAELIDALDNLMEDL